jgi:hypothetical protein
MTALTMQATRIATRFVEVAAPRLRTLRKRFLHILDALAEARMHKAQEEISRVRPMRRAESKSPVSATSARR